MQKIRKPKTKKCSLSSEELRQVVSYLSSLLIAAFPTKDVERTNRKRHYLKILLERISKVSPIKSQLDSIFLNEGGGYQTVWLQEEEIVVIYSYWIRQFYYDCNNTDAKQKMLQYNSMLEKGIANKIFNELTEELRNIDLFDSDETNGEPPEMDYDTFMNR